jgi:activating signal cointegrator complex subunit 2
MPASRTLPNEVIQCQETLHRLFFFVCLRASTHHESPTDFIEASVFGDILYENFIFDIPRLMDICVLYGYGCETAQLVQKMIENVFTRQPKYRDDLKDVVSNILQVWIYLFCH